MAQDSAEADYHRERALRELNAGLGASCSPSARAHLRLSTLHMQRARELGATLPPPPLIM
jgi:hypothetical protein